VGARPGKSSPPWERASSFIPLAAPDSWLDSREPGDLERFAIKASGPPRVDDTLLESLEEQDNRRLGPREIGIELLKVPWRLRRRAPHVAAAALRANREGLRIAAGRSKLKPSKGDRRFKDEAWTENVAYRRIAQLYLAFARAADEVVGAEEIDWRSERRLRLAVENLTEALAPTNFLATNPAALKRVIDTGGSSLVDGVKQFARDMSSQPRIPSTVDRSKFEIGRNLALSPGSVVLRTPMLELIQYAPVTDKVRSVPVLMVSSMVNKYYVLDLAPGRSLIEHLIAAGHTVFAISWRNPTEDQRDWGIDRYARGVLSALDAIAEITGEERVNVAALCAGGMVVAGMASALAREGHGARLRSLTLSVCSIDSTHAGAAGAMITPDTAPWLNIEAARRGYVQGHQIAGSFAWMRPNEGVWSYWVNNYLMGKRPPAVDILYWADDATNIPGALNRDMVRISLENAFDGNSDMTCLGAPLDLKRVRCDSFVIAAESDHLTPWQSCYPATELLGGRSSFLLSAGGHISATVNPPGGSRGGYWAGPAGKQDADEWVAAAKHHDGSWWEHWSAWLTRRGGQPIPARSELGSAAHPPIEPAPGTYVHARSDGS
jgi:polyhydroxyalkanoate synthase subunit PhaC